MSIRIETQLYNGHTKYVELVFPSCKVYNEAWKVLSLY